LTIAAYLPISIKMMHRIDGSLQHHLDESKVFKIVGGSLIKKHMLQKTNNTLMKNENAFFATNLHFPKR